MRRIKEVLTTLLEGATDPLLCRADDGREYVVKHRGCGRNALIREWIAGRIGHKLDLPLPDIELLTLERASAPLLLVPGADHLTACPAFGSCYVHSTVSFPASARSAVPPRQRAEVLLYDWWLLNGDRTDGNSNLLWEAHKSKLWVIDHNLAFDESERPDVFWPHHIFREDYRTWDKGFRQLMSLKMPAIIAELPQMWGELPVEWTTECDTTYDLVDRVLRRCESASFWDGP